MFDLINNSWYIIDHNEMILGDSPGLLFALIATLRSDDISHPVTMYNLKIRLNNSRFFVGETLGGTVVTDLVYIPLLVLNFSKSAQ